MFPRIITILILLRFMEVEGAAMENDWKYLAVDVSHYQGSINWTEIPENYIAGFAKATQGDYNTDPTFATNWEGMKARFTPKSGSPGGFGAYHFFDPLIDPLSQSQHIMKTLNSVNFGNTFRAVWVIDVEGDDCPAGVNPDQMKQNIFTIINAVRAKFTNPIAIYTRAEYWNRCVNTTDDWKHFPLWVSHYTDKPQPNLPRPWTYWLIWQYTEKGRISGIKGNVDLNRLNPGSWDFFKGTNDLGDDYGDIYHGEIITCKSYFGEYNLVFVLILLTTVLLAVSILIFMAIRWKSKYAKVALKKSGFVILEGERM